MCLQNKSVKKFCLPTSPSFLKNVSRNTGIFFVGLSDPEKYNFLVPRLLFSHDSKCSFRFLIINWPAIEFPSNLEYHIVDNLCSNILQKEIITCITHNDLRPECLETFFWTKSKLFKIPSHICRGKIKCHLSNRDTFYSKHWVWKHLIKALHVEERL